MKWPTDLKNCSNYWFLVRNIVTFTYCCSKFHHCKLLAKSSALFFWKFEIPDEVVELAFCDLMMGGVCAWQVVYISWSRWLLLFAVWRNAVFVVRVHSKIVRRFRNRKSITMRHRQNCWWYIQIHKCWFFSFGHTILNKGHHTEVTVSTVIDRHSPNHEHSRQYKPPFPFTHALSLDNHAVQHTCGANFFFWPPTLQTKYKKISFFIVGVV